MALVARLIWPWYSKHLQGVVAGAGNGECDDTDFPDLEPDPTI